MKSPLGFSIGVGMLMVGAIFLPGYIWISDLLGIILSFANIAFGAFFMYYFGGKK